MRRALIIAISVVFVLVVLSVVQAGSLTPTSSPGGTMYTLSQIFNPLASDSYSSSGISGDGNGSLIEMSKCVIEKMHGGSC